jgi:hypothetical protein
MKTFERQAIFTVVLIANMVLPPAVFISTTAENETDPQSSTGQELTWPREFEDNGTKLAIYQPQIEKWEGTDFASRAAVAITSPGADAPVYGVVWFNARADVDKAAGVVTLNDIQVTKVKFPTAPKRETEYLALIRRHVPTESRAIALDHLEASFAISEAVKKARAVPVKNNPPRIIYTTTPSLLVLVDGPPVLRPAPVPGFERVINTRALIVKFGDTYYLTAMNYWYQAAAVDGPWKPISVIASALTSMEEAAVAANQVDLMRPEEGTSLPEQPPAIYVSTVPAELIQTDGLPQFLPVEGTQLLQVQNSDNAIFMDVDTNDYYVLISGRWFKTKSLNGPWTFVPYKNLPADFAKIPPDHPKANALVSVPGTPEAREAVIANSIPQTATVNRSEANLDVTYDGAPQFQRIKGTPLYYAVNTPMPVIRVDTQTYYSVQNGVWFVATSANGPWVVATSVPAVIYSIPPSSPLYYVTFVRVYGSTADDVYVGYTPGYLGTVVCPDNVVVYGTGWYYPPYCGTYWVGAPCTYGFGAGFACGYDTDFDFGFADGDWLGTWCGPWWGAYQWGWHHGYRYTHVGINRVNIYQHWGDRVAVANRSYAANTWNGKTWTQSRTDHFSPYNRNFRVRAQAAVTSPRTTVAPSAPVIIRGTPNYTPPVAGEVWTRNNVYGGRDGNVYRNNPSGGWQRNAGSQWRSVPPSRAPEFNREAQGRAVGEQRFNNSRSYGGGFSRPQGGGSERR